MKCKFCGTISVQCDEYCLVCGRSKYSGNKKKDQSFVKIFSGMILVILFFFSFIYIADRRNYYDASEFTPTEGTISHVKSGLYHERCCGDIYRAYIYYDYIVDGVKYSENSYTLVSNSLDFDDFNDYSSLIGNYKTGTPIDVYFNNEDPSVAILDLDDLRHYDRSERAIPVALFILVLLIYIVIDRVKDITKT